MIRLKSLNVAKLFYYYNLATEVKDDYLDKK